MFSLGSSVWFNQHFTLTIPIAFAASKGFDIIGPQTTAGFACLKSQNYTYSIVRADSNTNGVIDPNAIATLQNAKAAGLSTSIYLFLCPGAPLTQVSTVISGINKSLYNIVWLKIATSSTTQCNWSNYSKAKNCQFLTSILQGTNSSGIKAGIFTIKTIWTANCGTTCSFGQLGYVSLWYADYLVSGKVESTQSFADFTAFGGFGGWTQPDLKMIVGNSTVTLCNNPKWTTFINLNWHS